MRGFSYQTYEVALKFSDVVSKLIVRQAKIVNITINENPNLPKPLLLETEIGASSSRTNYLHPQFKQIRLDYQDYKC